MSDSNEFTGSKEFFKAEIETLTWLDGLERPFSKDEMQLIASAFRRLLVERVEVVAILDEHRCVFAGLKKTDDWLAQLELELEEDTELLERAKFEYHETLGMAKKLADPAWAQTYMERVVGYSKKRLADKKKIDRLQTENADLRRRDGKGVRECVEEFAEKADKTAQAKGADDA